MGFDCVLFAGWRCGFGVAEEVAFTFWVDGRPAPQGSKTAYVRGGRAVMVEASKHLPAWRSAVMLAAKQELLRRDTWTHFSDPVRLSVTFYIERPQNPKHKLFPAGKPDLDHLIRAVGDSLTQAGVVADDALICEVVAAKVWTGAHTRPEPGAVIEISRL